MQRKSDSCGPRANHRHRCRSDPCGALPATSAADHDDEPNEGNSNESVSGLKAINDVLAATTARSGSPLD